MAEEGERRATAAAQQAKLAAQQAEEAEQFGSLAISPFFGGNFQGTEDCNCTHWGEDLFKAFKIFLHDDFVWRKQL